MNIFRGGSTIHYWFALTFMIFFFGFRSSFIVTVFPWLIKVATLMVIMIMRLMQYALTIRIGVGQALGRSCLLDANFQMVRCVALAQLRNCVIVWYSSNQFDETFPLEKLQKKLCHNCQEGRMKEYQDFLFLPRHRYYSFTKLLMPNICIPRAQRSPFLCQFTSH